MFVVTWVIWTVPVAIVEDLEEKSIALILTNVLSIDGIRSPHDGIVQHPVLYVVMSIVYDTSGYSTIAEAADLNF